MILPFSFSRAVRRVCRSLSTLLIWPWTSWRQASPQRSAVYCSGGSSCVISLLDGLLRLHIVTAEKFLHILARNRQVSWGHRPSRVAEHDVLHPSGIVETDSRCVGTILKGNNHSRLIHFENDRLGVRVTRPAVVVNDKHSRLHHLLDLLRFHAPSITYRWVIATTIFNNFST
jgi:hypothetical protein